MSSISLDMVEHLMCMECQRTILLLYVASVFLIHHSFLSFSSGYNYRQSVLEAKKVNKRQVPHLSWVQNVLRVDGFLDLA